LKLHLFEMQRHLHSQQQSLHSLSTQLADFEKDLVSKSGGLIGAQSSNLVREAELEEEKKEEIK